MKYCSYEYDDAMKEMTICSCKIEGEGNETVDRPTSVLRVPGIVYA